MIDVIERSAMKVTAVGNRKGGVGKTSTGRAPDVPIADAAQSGGQGA